MAESDTHPGAVATHTSDQQPGLSPKRQAEIRLVRQIVATLWAASFGMIWKGKAGLTARSCYAAMLRHAWHHGRLTVPKGEDNAGETVRAGVWLSVSHRQLAEMAGVNDSTVEGGGKATGVIKRLYGKRLLRRAGRGDRIRSGAFILTASHVQVRPFRAPTQEYRPGVGTSVTGVHRCPELARVALERARAALRWGAEGSAGLGKLAEFLLDALVMLGDSATDRELAIAVGRESRVRDVRACLNKLVEENILKRSVNRYYRHRNTGWELQFTREINGEIERGERQKEKHQRAREGNRNALEASEVPRQAKEKKSREKKIAKIKEDTDRLKKEQREADPAAFSPEQAATRYLPGADPAEGVVVGEEEPLPEPPEDAQNASLTAHPAAVEDICPRTSPPRLETAISSASQARRRSSGQTRSRSKKWR